MEVGAEVGADPGGKILTPEEEVVVEAAEVDRIDAEKGKIRVAREDLLAGVGSSEMVAGEEEVLGQVNH